MDYNKFPIEPKIERWHQDFDKLQQIWIAWCAQNASRYATASQAWNAFVNEQRLNSFKIDIRDSSAGSATGSVR